MFNTWEITDDKGVLFSGRSDEMGVAFDIMINPENYSKEQVDSYKTRWIGDLKLVEVHKVSR